MVRDLDFISVRRLSKRQTRRHRHTKKAVGQSHLRRTPRATEVGEARKGSLGEDLGESDCLGTFT